MPRARSPSSRWHLAATAVTAALLAASLPAQADLSSDTERLAQQWKQRGADVERLDPVFLERGRAKIVSAGRPTAPDAPSLAPAGDRGCLSFAFLAVRTTEFSIDLDPEDAAADARSAEKPPPDERPPPPGERRIRSAGGVAMVSRCGKARDELGRIAIEMASARAAVDVLRVRSAIPLGEIRDVLPERAAGPIAPRGDPGGAIEPGPLPERLARAELRARSEGAARVTRASMRSSVAGGGEFDLRLPAGCHRLELMAEVPATFPHRATDLDAEARAPEGRLLARDRADVPDARLDFCLGEPALIEVPFTGASGAVSVALTDAQWPLPAQVPATWGARARAGLSAALLRRHAPEPREPPILSSLGVQEVTQIPIAVEPGHCYLAAAALMRGEARVIRLLSRIGDRASHDESADRAESAALAFCAETEDTAVIEVDVRGSAPWWVLELWSMGVASP